MAARPRPSPKSRSQDELARFNSDLIASAYAGALEGVVDALNQGADVGYTHPQTGLSALHIAVGTNHSSITRILVEDWSAPFGPDGFGRWPTAVAAECAVSDELADYIVEKESAYLKTHREDEGGVFSGPSAKD